ncbi:MAG TPA: amino acid ABC transporter permease [Ktedonobacterales bacterium]|jgi:polar amino acid transport system permease protein|nr:amino acid ABC transporter permease [Ktedonobacterales bacterium]
MCPSTFPILQQFCAIVTLNGNYSWPVVGQNLFNFYIIQAIAITVSLAVLAQSFGVLIGLLLYFMRRSRWAVLRSLANGYIALFRGTPLIVQIAFTYALIPFLNLTSDPSKSLNHIIAHFNPFPALGFTNILLDGFVAALVALSLNEGAYMSEIVRAGIDSIDVGQMEAAKSLGMTYFLAMRRIVLPQAARVIIPPLGNEFNSMLKNTSLAFAISVGELFGVATNIAAPIFRQLELYTVAAFWYLILTVVWTAIQSLIERRLNVSVYDTGPTDRGSYWQRLIGFGRRPAAPGIPAGAVAIPSDRR